MISVQILGMEPTVYLFFFRAWWSLFSEMLKACPTLTLKRELRLWDKRPRTMSWLWRTWMEEPSLSGELPVFPLVLYQQHCFAVMEACSGLCLARQSSTLPSLPSSACTECSRDPWSGTDRWSSDPWCTLPSHTITALLMVAKLLHSSGNTLYPGMTSSEQIKTTFLFRTIKSAVEDPRVMLMDL